MINIIMKISTIFDIKFEIKINSELKFGLYYLCLMRVQIDLFSTILLNY